MRRPLTSIAISREILQARSWWVNDNPTSYGDFTYLCQLFSFPPGEQRVHLPSTLELHQQPQLDLESHFCQQGTPEMSSWHWRSLLARTVDMCLG